MSSNSTPMKNKPNLKSLKTPFSSSFTYLMKKPGPSMRKLSIKSPRINCLMFLLQLKVTQLRRFFRPLLLCCLTSFLNSRHLTIIMKFWNTLLKESMLSWKNRFSRNSLFFVEKPKELIMEARCTQYSKMAWSTLKVTKTNFPIFQFTT